MTKKIILITILSLLVGYALGVATTVKTQRIVNTTTIEVFGQLFDYE